MKKWYGVQSCFYDNGQVIANLVDVVEADSEPDRIVKETRRCDIYIDWFPSEKKAMEFVEECRRA